MLAGEVEFTIGDRTVRAGAGAALHVPPGTVHTFANVGDVPAKWIGIFSPGRFVALIEEIGKAFPPGDGPPDEAKLMAAFSAYDTEVVEP